MNHLSLPHILWLMQTPDSVMGPAEVRAVILVLSTALSLCGIYLLILWRRNRIVGRLRRGAERFAAGELTGKLPVEGPPDLVRLAEALNRMASQLDERLKHHASQRNEVMAVMGSMSEGVVAIDQDERVMNINPAAAQLLDLDPLNTIGRAFVEVVRNPALQDLVQRALASRQQEQAEITLRPQARHPHGQAAALPAPRQLLAQATALRDAWGRRIGVLLVVLDVTRLRQLEAVRREFVANVSHEVKTPVAAIKAAAETLLEMPETGHEDVRKFLRMIARQADRLNALVDDLLNLARIEQDQDNRRIVRSVQPVAPVVEHAVEAARLRARPKDILFEVTCPAELELPINAELLEQALVNLLDNAVKYSPTGRRVAVTARIEASETVLEVRDQGMGIAPEHLTRIFERFYRVDKARSREMGGTGLGLAIVKHVALAHGGRVSVDSTPGVGSVFRIHLPLHLPAETGKR